MLNAEYRIPPGHALQLTEYLCPACANEFYVPAEDTQFKCPRLFCPFAGIKSNGDLKVYVKRPDARTETES